MLIDPDVASKFDSPVAPRERRAVVGIKIDRERLSCPASAGCLLNPK